MLVSIAKIPSRNIAYCSKMPFLKMPITVVFPTSLSVFRNCILFIHKTIVKTPCV